MASSPVLSPMLILRQGSRTASAAAAASSDLAAWAQRLPPAPAVEQPPVLPTVLQQLQGDRVHHMVTQQPAGWAGCSSLGASQQSSQTVVQPPAWAATQACAAPCLPAPATEAAAPASVAAAVAAGCRPAAAAPAPAAPGPQRQHSFAFVCAHLDPGSSLQPEPAVAANPVPQPAPASAALMGQPATCRGGAAAAVPAAKQRKRQRPAGVKPPAAAQQQRRKIAPTQPASLQEQQQQSGSSGDEVDVPLTRRHSSRLQLPPSQQLGSVTTSAPAPAATREPQARACDVFDPRGLVGSSDSEWSCSGSEGGDDEPTPRKPRAAGVARAPASERAPAGAEASSVAAAKPARAPRKKRVAAAGGGKAARGSAAGNAASGVGGGDAGGAGGGGAGGASNTKKPDASKKRGAGAVRNNFRKFKGAPSGEGGLEAAAQAALLWLPRHGQR